MNKKKSLPFKAVVHRILRLEPSSMRAFKKYKMNLMLSRLMMRLKKPKVKGSLNKTALKTSQSKEMR